MSGPVEQLEDFSGFGEPVSFEELPPLPGPVPLPEARPALPAMLAGTKITIKSAGPIGQETDYVRWVPGKAMKHYLHEARLMGRWHYCRMMNESHRPLRLSYVPRAEELIFLFRSTRGK